MALGRLQPLEHVHCMVHRTWMLRRPFSVLCTTILICVDPIQPDMLAKRRLINAINVNVTSISPSCHVEAAGLALDVKFNPRVWCGAVERLMSGGIIRIVPVPSCPGSPMPRVRRSMVKTQYSSVVMIKTDIRSTDNESRAFHGAEGAATHRTAVDR